MSLVLDAWRRCRRSRCGLLSTSMVSIVGWTRNVILTAETVGVSDETVPVLLVSVFVERVLMTEVEEIPVDESLAEAEGTDGVTLSLLPTVLVSLGLKLKLVTDNDWAPVEDSPVDETRLPGLEAANEAAPFEEIVVLETELDGTELEDSEAEDGETAAELELGVMDWLLAESEEL